MFNGHLQDKGTIVRSECIVGALQNDAGFPPGIIDSVCTYQFSSRKLLYTLLGTLVPSMIQAMLLCKYVLSEHSRPGTYGILKSSTVRHLAGR